MGTNCRVQVAVNNGQGSDIVQDEEQQSHEGAVIEQEVASTGMMPTTLVTALQVRSIELSAVVMPTQSHITPPQFVLQWGMPQDRHCMPIGWMPQQIVVDLPWDHSIVQHSNPLTPLANVTGYRNFENIEQLRALRTHIDRVASTSVNTCLQGYLIKHL